MAAEDSEVDTFLEDVHALASQLVSEITEATVKRFENYDTSLCELNVGDCSNCRTYAVDCECTLKCKRDASDYQHQVYESQEQRCEESMKNCTSLIRDHSSHADALKTVNCDFDLCDTFIKVVFDENEQDVRGSARGKGQQTKKNAKKTRKEKKMKKKLKDFAVSYEPLPTYEEMGFWTEADLATPVDSSLVCPVCMELFYQPHSCLPCDHVFCEPCLRRMAKYNKDNRMNSVCPICRQEILYCVPNEVKRVQAQTSHNYAYNRRRKSEGRSKHMSHPLPAKTTAVRKQDIVNAVSSRQRNAPYRQWIVKPSIKKLLATLMMIIMVLLFLFVLLKLLTAYDNDYWILRWYVQFCERLWHYGTLQHDVQLTVTNQAVIVSCLITLTTGIVCVIL